MFNCRLTIVTFLPIIDGLVQEKGRTTDIDGKKLSKHIRYEYCRPSKRQYVLRQYRLLNLRKKRSRRYKPSYILKNCSRGKKNCSRGRSASVQGVGKNVPIFGFHNIC